MLAFIEKFLECDVIYDLIKAVAHVQNCMASDWSVYIDIDMDVDSCRKSKDVGPLLQRGGYREILNEPMWRGGTKGPHQ